jgi:hypothetical protein
MKLWLMPYTTYGSEQRFFLWKENPRTLAANRFNGWKWDVNEKDLRDFGFTRKLPKGGQVLTVELTLK